jgi:hypothetical protein
LLLSSTNSSDASSSNSTRLVITSESNTCDATSSAHCTRCHVTSGLTNPPDISDSSEPISFTRRHCTTQAQHSKGVRSALRQQLHESPQWTADRTKTEQSVAQRLQQESVARQSTKHATMSATANQVDLNLVWQLLEQRATALNQTTSASSSPKEQSQSSSSQHLLLGRSVSNDSDEAKQSAAAQEKLLRAWLARQANSQPSQAPAETRAPIHVPTHRLAGHALHRRSVCSKCKQGRTNGASVAPATSASAAVQLSHLLRKAGKGSLKRLRDHQKRLRKQILLATHNSSNLAHASALNHGKHPSFCPDCDVQSPNRHPFAATTTDYGHMGAGHGYCVECAAAAIRSSSNPKAYWNANALQMHHAHDLHLPTYAAEQPMATSMDQPDACRHDNHQRSSATQPPLTWDVEQWRRKLRKQRLKRKERNVLMLVLSVAILLFIGISYFGAILFIRTTRMQDTQ